jgi:hypothetical protein
VKEGDGGKHTCSLLSRSPAGWWWGLVLGGGGAMTKLWKQWWAGCWPLGFHAFGSQRHSEIWGTR